VKARQTSIEPRFRVNSGPDIALGPGKVELLEWVEKTGSIAAAARGMGMSYMRAWMLIKTMERCFKEPLLQVARGGARHGGAKLTPNGRKVLGLYRQMEHQSLAVTRSLRKSILSRLRA
jgi:molybdate transport system regulatory protein